MGPENGSPFILKGLVIQLPKVIRTNMLRTHANLHLCSMWWMLTATWAFKDLLLVLDAYNIIVLRIPFGSTRCT